MRNTKPFSFSNKTAGGAEILEEAKKKELIHELSDSHTLAMNKNIIELSLNSKEQLSNLKHRMFSLLLFLNSFFSAGIGRVFCS